MSNLCNERRLHNRVYFSGKAREDVATLAVAVTGATFSLPTPVLQQVRYEFIDLMFTVAP